MSLLRVLILLFGLALLLLIGAYVAFPQLASWAAPRFAESLGLSELQVLMGRPGLERVRILSISAASEDFQLVAEDVQLSYSFSSLRIQRLESLEVRRVSVTVDAGQEPGGAEADQPLPRAEVLFALAPFERARIDEFRVQVPALGFIADGTLSLETRQLQLSLRAQEPEQARGIELSARFSASGEIAAELSRAEPGAVPFLQINSGLPQQELEIDAEMQLSGFALELVSTVAGLPQGDGSVTGRFQVRHPWPMSDGVNWDLLAADGPFSIDWQAAESGLSIESVRGVAVLTGGTLEADLEGTVSLLEEGLEVTVVPHRVRATLVPLAVSFEADMEADMEADTEADIEGSVETAHIRGALKANASTSASGSLVEMALDLKGSVDALERQFPLALEVSGRLGEEALEAELHFTSGAIVRAPVVVRYQSDGRRIQADLDHRVQIQEPLLSALWPGWKENFDLDGGAVRLTGSLTGQLPDDLKGAGTVKLENVASHYDDIAIRGLQGDLMLDTDGRTIVLQPSGLTATLIDVGVPLRAVSTTVAGSAERLNFTNTTAQTLGGTLRIEPFSYTLSDGRADVVVELVGLELAEVLALEGDHITGTGRLDGRLPVAIHGNQARIVGGRIVARPPGGVIQLSMGVAGALTQPGLDLALGALTDFRYEVLETTVEYSETGDMNLGVRLQGRNPQVEKGRAIHYNLNVSENIPVLLESLRLQDSFTQRIEKEVSR